MTSSQRFEGQTVIVTGAGSGIGRATALRLAQEGARVIASDIVERRLADLAAEAPTIVTVLGDISTEEAVDRVVAVAGDRIDGLANIAGIMDSFQGIHEMDDAIWDRVFAINVNGMMRLTRAVTKHMLAAGSGSVVNVSSEAGLRGSAAGLAYTASKHAVVGITKSSAVMYLKKGLRFNAVAPGGTATNIQAEFKTEIGAEVFGTYGAIIPPIAQPEQLAAAITWLLSNDASNVSGVILPCDGGWSAI